MSSLAGLFFELGNLHLKLGDLSCLLQLQMPKDMYNQLVGKNSIKNELDYSLKYYNNAAIRYFYAKNLLNDTLIINPEYQNTSQLTIQNIDIKLDDLHKKTIIHASLSNNKNTIIFPEINEKLLHYQKLEDLRIESFKNIKQIKKAKRDKQDQEFISLTQSAFNLITEEIKGYIKILYEEAENTLGSPPCGYSLVGLGSMALGQMTPYSDLEFAILTENDEYEKNQDFRISEYFKNLSYIVNFRVICLGETSLPSSDYNLNLDHLATPAINFDLGGKTPIGRLDGIKPYTLIQTVDKMLFYLKNEESKSEHIDKNLPYILETTTFIAGEQTIFDKYKKEANEFLSTKVLRTPQSHYEVRAIKALEYGTIEMDYNRPVLEQEKYTAGNLEAFSFKAQEKRGQLFDVKQEIYRMPDRFIYNFGKLYNIIGNNSWNTIDQLVEKKIITYQAGQNLKQALSFAVSLRLETYIYYGYQKEQIDISVSTESNNLDMSTGRAGGAFQLSKDDLTEDGPLFKFYYSMIPLVQKLSEFCQKASELSQNQKRLFFSTEAFFETNIDIKYQIYTRIIHNVKSIELLRNSVLNSKESKNFKESVQYVESLLKLGNLFRESEDYTKALAYFYKALELGARFLSPIFPVVLSARQNIALVYNMQGESEKALKIFLDILPITVETNRSVLEVATLCNNIGLAYADLNQHEKAIEYKKTALKLLESETSKNWPEIAKFHNNIGYSYRMLKEYDKALYHQNESLRIRKNTLVPKHKDIAISIESVAGTYLKMGNFHKGLELRLQALEILEKSTNTNNTHIARSCTNIACTYMNLKNYKKVLEYLLKTWVLERDLYGSDSVQVKETQELIDSTKTKIFQIKEQANKAYEQAKNLQQLGKKSASRYEEALELFEQIGDTQTAIKVLQNLIVIYQDKDNKVRVTKLLESKIQAIQHLQEKNLIVKNTNKVNKFINNIDEDIQQISNHKVKVKSMYDMMSDFEDFKVKVNEPLTRQISRFIEIPNKQPGEIRVTSYNIAVNFFADKDKTEDIYHNWFYCLSYIQKLLGKLLPDIMCLQGLSPEQALDLVKYFESTHHAVFLIQTPADLPAGLIMYDLQVGLCIGKKIGTSLIGTLVSKSLCIKEANRFWLNENPNEIPQNKDQTETDKGFGNINTYRAVLWIKAEENNSSKILFIFNSHYPLSGNNETRFKCAQLEMESILEITNGKPWISAGDRNIIPNRNSNEKYSIEEIYQKFTQTGYDFRDSGNHYGTSSTWLGFSYDPYISQMEPQDVKEAVVLDIIVSSDLATLSFIHPGAFNPHTEQIVDLSDSSGLSVAENERYFAADHALIGADFDFFLKDDDHV